jgi:hypothetical protein
MVFRGIIIGVILAIMFFWAPIVFAIYICYGS